MLESPWESYESGTSHWPAVKTPWITAEGRPFVGFLSVFCGVFLFSMMGYNQVCKRLDCLSKVTQIKSLCVRYMYVYIPQKYHDCLMVWYSFFSCRRIRHWNRPTQHTNSHGEQCSFMFMFMAPGKSGFCLAVSRFHGNSQDYKHGPQVPISHERSIYKKREAIPWCNDCFRWFLLPLLFLWFMTLLSYLKRKKWSQLLDILYLLYHSKG